MERVTHNLREGSSTSVSLVSEKVLVSSVFALTCDRERGYSQLRCSRPKPKHESRRLNYPYFVQLGPGESARFLSRSKSSEKTSE